MSVYALDVSKLFGELTTSYTTYRSKIKEIKKKEEDLIELQEKHKNAAKALNKAREKKNPTDVLEREEKDLNYQTKKQKSLHEGEMRSLLKEGLTIQYQSLADFSQKLSTLAHFGKHMVSQIPQGTVSPGQELPPYMGAPVTKKIRDGIICFYDRLLKRNGKTQIFKCQISDSPSIVRINCTYK